MWWKYVLSVYFFIGCAVSVYSSGSISSDNATTDPIDSDNHDFIGAIVGGSLVTDESMLFTVSLTYYDKHFCGGTILNDWFIMTASHCVKYDLPIYINIGSLEWKKAPYRARVQRYYRFNNRYDGSNDIALIKVQQPIPAIYPRVNITSVPIDSTEMTSTLGWGYIKEGSGVVETNMRIVDVPLTTEQSCKNAYSRVDYKKEICAGYEQGGKDSCSGDSGGPLILKSTNEQIGIVSWGRGCARPGYPGVYVRVSHYQDWIDKIVNGTPNKRRRRKRRRKGRGLSDSERLSDEILSLEDERLINT